MKHRLLPIVASTLLIFSCDRGGQLVTTEPSMTDVVGRYRLSHSSFGGAVDSEILARAKDSYIDLKANGEVVLHQVPVVANSDLGPFLVSEFRTDSGTFSIAPLGGNATTNFYGLSLECEKILPKPIGNPRFKRHGPSLLLTFNYFDGDFTERMTFVRTE